MQRIRLSHPLAAAAVHQLVDRQTSAPVRRRWFSAWSSAFPQAERREVDPPAGLGGGKNPRGIDLQGDQDGAGTIGDLELSEDVPDVGLGGAYAYP